MSAEPATPPAAAARMRSAVEAAIAKAEGEQGSKPAWTATDRRMLAETWAAVQEVNDAAGALMAGGELPSIFSMMFGGGGRKRRKGEPAGIMLEGADPADPNSVAEALSRQIYGAPVYIQIGGEPPSEILERLERAEAMVADESPTYGQEVSAGGE